ncbi:uncharacterized protein LOC136074963 [Hydra vulgaris]|uniref:Uncharacterized protein LOC136074963 n=1 Tax=Hydra vulgaris TaxID=6087 RepID=A0ABM4B331_HYDVU
MIQKKNYVVKETFFFVFSILNQVEARELDQVFYWQIKPFIFINSNNTIDGILPVMYERLAELCSPNKKLAEFHLVNETFSPSKLYKSVEKAFGLQSQPNINNTVWYPIFFWPENVHLSPYNLKYNIFLTSPSIGVIANKNKITITNKIVESIKKSSSIALHAVGLTLIFAAVVWLAECKKNKNFYKLFLKGFGKSLWWAVVTLSTVGYGDIVPESLTGRILSIFWMIIGVILVSGMTGTFSSVMTTNSFLSLHNQKIAAIINSFDFHVAQKNFNSSLKRAYESYEDVLQDVNLNNVEYGVINIDVLLNIDYKENYQNVVLVQVLDATSPVLIAFGSQTNVMANLYPYNTNQYDPVLDCLKNLNFKDILKNLQDFNKKIPLIDTESAQNFDDFMKMNYIKYSLIAILLIIFIFTIKDVIPFIYNKYKRQKQSETLDTIVPMTFFFNRHLNEEKKSTSLNDIQEELTFIKEQLMKLNNAILSKECCPCSKQPSKVVYLQNMEEGKTNI